MLTIQNVRKDVKTIIGDYTLSDCGLSSPLPNGTGEYYSFYWTNAEDSTRTFKFLLDREEIKSNKPIYRIRLYDTKKRIVGTNRDGFVYEGNVGKTLLRDRIEFYQYMIKTIGLYY